jgi:hypothetical protein
MKIGHLLVSCATATLMLQGCVFTRKGLRTSGLGAWPPTSAQCVRNNGVPFYSGTNSIGKELTRLFADPACVAQSNCSGWVEKESHYMPDSNPASNLWNGLSNHSFTALEQNNIGATARSYATGRTPPGKRLYRLTFDQGIAVGSGPSSGRVDAIAYYGRCIADITATANPRQIQN